MAVLVSVWLQNRKEKRGHKLWIFSKLMEMRHSLSDETVRALNMIDVVFADKPGVRQLWREYFEMLCNRGLDGEPGWKQRQAKNLELITEMAKVCGYGKEITHLDVDRVYHPQALMDGAQRQRDISDELLRVLKSSEGYLLAPRDTMRD